MFLDLDFRTNKGPPVEGFKILLTKKACPRGAFWIQVLEEKKGLPLEEFLGSEFQRKKKASPRGCFGKKNPRGGFLDKNH